MDGGEREIFFSRNKSQFILTIKYYTLRMNLILSSNEEKMRIFYMITASEKSHFVRIVENGGYNETFSSRILYILFY